MAKAKMSGKRKAEIIVAIVLLLCLVVGSLLIILIEKSVGKPVYYEGDMKNICVRINEICTSNHSIIADENGNFSDYIELYNYGETFLLTGFGLSNDTGNGVEYTFGEVEFKKDSYLVVFLDGKNVPFKLSSKKPEYISFVAWDKTVICSATTVPCEPDQVLLYSDTGYYVSDEPSPGYPNDKAGIDAFKNGVVDTNPSLVINEISISNGSALADCEGDFGDVIEIKNISNEKVSTAGYYISDSLSERSKCALPQRDIEPGGFMLIFASGKGKTFENGEFHTNFRVSDREDVVLSGNGKYTSVKAVADKPNASQSRVINEKGEVSYAFTNPSLGFDNTPDGEKSFAESRTEKNPSLVITELLLASDETFYKGALRDVIEITNITNSDVSTAGWALSDSPDDPYEFRLPNMTLKPNECVLFYAEHGEGSNVTGFALSSRETVTLMAPSHKIASAVSCVSAGRGKSWQRVAENGSCVYMPGKISLGFLNNDDGTKKYEKDTRPDSIEISEAVPLNHKYLTGPYGTYHDFVELHNRTDKPVVLDGWYLSDDVKEPKKASLDGMTVPANGYLVIILSPDGINVPGRYNYVKFSLASSGETLVLSNGDAAIDCAVIPPVGENTSFGRADGADGFSVLSEPTPGAKNGYAVREKTSKPSSSLSQGVYNDTDGLLVELSGDGTIYYTLDCTEPNAMSAVYTSPIKITSTTVLRCRAMKNGREMSDTLDLTYIVNEGHTLDAVSVVTNPENLWDYYTGIYETGPNASSEFPYVGANYWQPWEKKANLSLFTSDGGFSVPCGLKIFGAYSRALPKKSFSCFFRAKYGASNLHYKLFENDDLDVFEALVLRNTGQDWNKANMKDAMLSSLVYKHTGIDVQKCRPVVLYLNGEYWGVYFIREKINENFIAGHYNVKPEQVDLCRASGTNSEAYQNLMKYVRSHNLSVRENYDYVASLVDIDNYIDYIIAEICMANTDNGNIRFYKTEVGKWRWIMFDVDQSFRQSNHNTVAAHLNPAGTGSMNRFPTTLINGLLKNQGFKDKFLKRFAWQMKNIWDADVVNAHIDLFVSAIGEEMKRDCARWERE